MKKLQKLKQIQKEYAVKIRKLKSTRKSCKNGYVPLLDSMRWNARHNHIAYCMLHGKKYEEIEKGVCRPDNAPNMARVEKIMEDYRDEDVCASA
jgi:hypothetical protein